VAVAVAVAVAERSTTMTTMTTTAVAVAVVAVVVSTCARSEAEAEKMVAGARVALVARPRTTAASCTLLVAWAGFLYMPPFVFCTVYAGWLVVWQCVGRCTRYAG
jgi:hypothetical protein